VITLPPLIGSVALASLLVGFVMANYAPGTRPEHSVMTRKMPGDPADRGALQAALGRGWW
jgi:hypothetical protein